MRHPDVAGLGVEHDRMGVVEPLVRRAHLGDGHRCARSHLVACRCATELGEKLEQRQPHVAAGHRSSSFASRSSSRFL